MQSPTPPILGPVLKFDISIPRHNMKRVEILTDQQVAAYSLCIGLGQENSVLSSLKLGRQMNTIP